MGTGTILKLVAGIGVGREVRVPGTVDDGYKYLSPCSSQLRAAVVCNQSVNQSINQICFGQPGPSDESMIKITIQ